MDGAMTFLMPGKEGEAKLPAINGHLAMAGLSITREDALMLAKQRSELLLETERTEFGPPAIETIAEAMASSPFLMQDNVADALAELQGAFYALRDDLPVDVSDAEIAEAMRGCFDAYEGDLTEVSTLSREGVMAFSKEYRSMRDVRHDEAYRIVDDEGRVYAFDPVEWDYDEHVVGWNGEGWSDDWGD